MIINKAKSKLTVHWEYCAVSSILICSFAITHHLSNRKGQNKVDNYKISTLSRYPRDQFGFYPASLNAKVREDTPSLYDAVQKNDAILVKNLLNAGADPESLKSSTTDNVIPPLLEAVYQNNEQIIRLLLRKAANPNRKAVEGDRPLCAVRDIKIAKLLLEHGADIHLHGFHHKVGSYTPLYAAVFQVSNGADDTMQHKIATYILNKGADLNSKVGREGWTVLMEEAGNYRPDYLVEWIKRGANVNQRTKSGFSSLMFAAEVGSNQNMEVLLRHGAKVNQLTKKKQSALMLAAEHGDPGTVKLLLHWGADLSLKDRSGKTALDYALANNNTTAAQALLKADTKHK